MPDTMIYVFADKTIIKTPFHRPQLTGDDLIRMVDEHGFVTVGICKWKPEETK